MVFACAQPLGQCRKCKHASVAVAIIRLWGDGTDIDGRGRLTPSIPLWADDLFATDLHGAVFLPHDFRHEPPVFLIALLNRMYVVEYVSYEHA